MNFLDEFEEYEKLVENKIKKRLREFDSIMQGYLNKKQTINLRISQDNQNNSETKFLAETSKKDDDSQEKYSDEKLMNEFFQDIDKSKNLISTILKYNIYENKRKKVNNTNIRRTNKNLTCFNQSSIRRNSNNNFFFKYLTEEKIITNSIVSSLWDRISSYVPNNIQFSITNDNEDSQKQVERGLIRKKNLKITKNEKNDQIDQNKVKAELNEERVTRKIKEFKISGFFKRTFNLEKIKKTDNIKYRGVLYNQDQIVNQIKLNTNFPKVNVNCLENNLIKFKTVSATSKLKLMSDFKLALNYIEEKGINKNRVDNIQKVKDRYIIKLNRNIIQNK